MIATVNEDAYSALYVIRPNAPASDAVTRYSYSGALPHGGGTDAISIYRKLILISASAPGTNGSSVPSASDPAVYLVSLDRSTQLATATPLFYDESSSSAANVGETEGSTTQLMLTDPDSNEVVPRTSSRFAGEFLLTSQGDEEQIYVSSAGTSRQALSVLTLTQSVDDTAWTTKGGSLFSTDSTNDAVDVVTGTFERSEPMVVATPCGANSAPPDCTSPNYLATLDPATDTVTQEAVSSAPYTPQGAMAFVRDHGRDQR